MIRALILRAAHLRLRFAQSRHAKSVRDEACERLAEDVNRRRLDQSQYWKHRQAGKLGWQRRKMA